MPSKCIIHSVSQLKEKKWPFAQKQFGTQPDDYHKKPKSCCKLQIMRG